MLKFESVHAVNFMPFEELSFTFSDSGLHLITGFIDGDGQADSNGSGKSSITEALVWGLFGNTLRGNKADEIIKIGTKFCCVDVTFSSGGVRYFVKRCRKHPKLGNSVSIEVENNDGRAPISVSSIDDADKKIQGALGMSFELFKNSVCFGQGLPYRFVQSPDASKKAIMDEILDLLWISDARVKTGRLRDAAGKTREKFVISKSEQFGHISAYKKMLLSVLDSIDTAKENKKNMEAALLKFDNSPANANNKIPTVAGAIETLEKEYKYIEEEISKLNLESNFNSKEISSLKERAAEARDELTKAEKSVSLGKLISGEGKCPACGSDVGADRASHILDERENTRLNLASKIANIKKEMDDLVAMRDSRINKVKSMDARLRSVGSAIATYKFELKELEFDRKEQDSKKEDLRRRIESCLSSIEEKNKDARKIEIDVRNAEADLYNTESAILLYDKIIEDLTFWFDGFGPRGIKAKLMDRVVPFINSRAASYSASLTGGNVSIEFKSQMETKSGVRDKIDVDIRHKDNKISYSMESGGEKKRVDAIVILALHDLIAEFNGVKTNIQIFDEVFENLDATGTERLIALLKQRAQTCGVYVISHDEEVSSFFDTITTVKKVGDTSSV